MIDGLIGLAGLGVIAATAVSFAGHWRLALFSHFRPQLGATALVVAALAAALHGPHWQQLALALLVAAAANFSSLRHAVPRRRLAVPDAPGLRIAFANVFLHNKQYRRTVEWVRSEQPDLFIACEAYGAWPEQLAVLADIYPFVTRQPFADIVVYSRWPSVRAHHVFKSWNGNAVVLEIDSDQGPVTVVALHTMVAWREEPGQGGYNLIADITRLLVERQGDLIVLGDFNATPWSAPVRRMIERTGLTFGPGSWRGSFPAWLPTWMGLPIDLALARGAWHMTSRQIGPRIGSDHWPVIFEAVRQKGPEIRSP